jgi:tRNA dimethylallyltransferase
MKPPLIILTGPTAVGKTTASIKLAKEIGGEIICADSMQVYRHMDIGSAKIKPDEMSGIPHYLIDVLDPNEEFNVAKFKEMALQATREIYSRGRIPIVVGGTGFYIQALLYDIDFTEHTEDGNYRNQLEEILKIHGKSHLHNRLKEVDEQAALEIHPHNTKRVIRALEFYHLSGQKISEHNEVERQKVSPYNYVYFVLTDIRACLYERIEKRVDLMIEQGLVAEVAKLKEMGLTENMVSMQGLGYKEILTYLDGKTTLEEAIAITKRNTRRFAKRQLTWFRREKDVIWIYKDEFDYDEDGIVKKMSELVKRAQLSQKQLPKTI